MIWIVCPPLQPFDAFKARLIGSSGYGNIFMSTSSFVQGHNGTPSARTTQFQKASRGQLSKPVEVPSHVTENL